MRTVREYQFERFWRQIEKPFEKIGKKEPIYAGFAFSYMTASLFANGAQDLVRYGQTGNHGDLFVGLLELATSTGFFAVGYRALNR